MPDLVTHTVVGYFAIRRWLSSPLSLLFLVGNMLPDLLTRPFYIIMPSLFWWMLPIHTPAGMVVVCWGISGFFRAGERRKVFWVLLIGSMTHFILDALQKHIGLGYFWFGPFTWWSSDWGLFWPEDALSMLPWLLIAGLVFEIALRAFRRKKARIVSHDPNK